jgi:hypothetical protein
MTAYEDFVIEHVRKGEKTLGLYPPTSKPGRARLQAHRRATPVRSAVGGDRLLRW